MAQLGTFGAGPISEAANYGSIASNYTKIDVNYVNKDNGDIMHANALAYDAQRDLIYMSVNFYSEVWVIDHNTTTATAQGGWRSSVSFWQS